MMNERISRREFLKLASLVGLSAAGGALFAGDPLRAPAQPGAPNILVLVFDSLSASNMSLYGYPRATTPNIQRAAERAVVFHRHYAGGNFTSPGTATLLTGVYPWAHRALHLQSQVTPEYEARNLFALAARLGYFQTAYTHNLLAQTLLHQFRADLDNLLRPRDLARANLQYAETLFYNDFTPAFLAEWQSMRNHGSLFLPWLFRLARYRQKQQVTRELGARFPRGVPALHNQFFILEDAIDWVIAQAATLPQPYLSYVHLLPPHEPYTTRADFIDVFDDGRKFEVKPAHALADQTPWGKLLYQRRAYDEYLAYADAEFGRLLDALQAAGSLENTFLVLTSDHGESFERGLRGHITPLLFEPLTRIPLVVIPPIRWAPPRGWAPPSGEARRDVYTPTSNVDLLPTLVGLMGGAVPDWAAGQPLPHLGGDPAGDEERPIFTIEAKSNAKLAPLKQATVAMVKGDRKIIRYLGYPKLERDYEAYDLAEDPDELNDLYAAGRSRVEDLRIELDDHLQRADEPFRRD